MTRFLNGRRRPSAGALFFCLAAAAAACSDLGPRAGDVVAIAVAPTYSADALASYQRAGAGLYIDNMRLRFERAGGALAGDTTITLALGQDSVVVEATVRLNTSPERLTARLELRLGQVVLFAGATDFLAVAGGATQAPAIVMQYVGPVTVPPAIPVASSLVLVTTDVLSGVVGQPLPVPIVVQVLSSEGAPVPNVPITWTLGGGGSVGQAATVTDTAGRSRNPVTLGPTAGTQTLQATANGVSPLVVNLTALAGPASRVLLATRPAPSVVAGLVLGQQPVARIVDAAGNTVTSSTAPVRASAAGASLLGTTSVAAVGGVARFTDLGITGLLGTVLMHFESAGLTSDTASVQVLPPPLTEDPLPLPQLPLPPPMEPLPLPPPLPPPPQLPTLLLLQPTSGV